MLSLSHADKTHVLLEPDTLCAVELELALGPVQHNTFDHALHAIPWDPNNRAPYWGERALTKGGVHPS
eukprot:8895524-Pyramimonas_sp.AAC.2